MKTATMNYRVWVKDDREIECFSVFAQFRYMQEAIDYCQYCQKQGVDCHLTGDHGFHAFYPKNN
jgi:hypothetical protein